MLVERVERLMTIPAVGPITALTWALEVGDAQRFSSIKKAISYCGLCGAEKSSSSTVQRTPLSKQRNKHLQTTNKWVRIGEAQWNQCIGWCCIDRLSWQRLSGTDCLGLRCL